MKRKFLALLLAFVMVAGMLPMAALAETTETPVIPAILGDTDSTYSSKQLNLDSYTATAVKNDTLTSAQDKITVYDVTVTHPALLKHHNAQTPAVEGLWVGIGAKINQNGNSESGEAGKNGTGSSYIAFTSATTSEFSTIKKYFTEKDWASQGVAGYSEYGWRAHENGYVFQWYNLADTTKYEGKNPYLVERYHANGDTDNYTYNVYKIDFQVTEGHLVKFETPANGTLSVKAGSTDVTNNMPYGKGTKLTITATPNTGYKVGSVKVGETALTAEADGTYTTTVSDADVTISAEFAALPPEPTFTAVTGTEKVYEKEISVLQEGVEIEKNADGKYVISGTLKKVTEAWTEFNDTYEPEQTGYYVAYSVPKTIGTDVEVASMTLYGHDAQGNQTTKTYTSETTPSISSVFNDNGSTACYVITHVADADATVSEVKAKEFTIKLKYGDQDEVIYTFVCSGVTPEGAAADTFTVTFNLNGATGTVPEVLTVESGATITAPANPSRDGYSFGGWYKEAECTSAWDFDTDTVTENTTLYAKWTQNSTPSGGGGGSTTTTPPVSTDKDSGTTSTTVKPSVKDETASVTVSDSTANALVNKTLKDKTDNAVIEVKPTSNKEVSEVKAEIPAKAVANLAEKTDASLTVATPVANVTISNDALADVSKDAKTVAVTAAAKTDETSGETTYEVAVLKDGEPVNDIKGEMKVSLPVDEKTAEAGKGLVAVLVDENGNETVITKSVMTEDGQMVMSLGTGTATIKYVDNSRDYDDEIPEWAADAVQFTSSRQLFLGVSEGDFGANETMNRAMLVTVLHRLEGEPTPTKEADFADVTSDSWYAASAAWSAEMGIVAGTENGFDGNRPITRQDLALMLYRYANVYGSGKGTSTDFTHMGGAEDVADYAAEAMSWAVGSGIIVGDENNNLDPQSPTTRAQVSVMLMRFVELLAAK